MKIKDYIELSGQTQAEFAEIIGVTQAMVSLYISGKKSPRKKTANMIYKATKGAVGFADLYSETSEHEA